MRNSIKLLIISVISILGKVHAYDLNEVEHRFPERHRFESLLAAGRLSSFPLAPGVFLALVANEKLNWNVSIKGIDNVLDLSEEQLLSTYKGTLELLKLDENVTVSNDIYDLHEGWNSSESSSDNLKSLGITSVEQVKWDNKNANKTWELINNRLAENTNNIMDGKLIPRDSGLGRPFPASSDSIITSTFYYKNTWKTPWENIPSHKFGDSGKVPFLHLESQLSLAEERDFTAINVPLEGDMKSVVFILPKVDITKFHNKVRKSRINSNSNEVQLEDVVPFPKRWETTHLSISIPVFNLTDIQQYGLELEELGMNETFCTTRRDRRGKLPYYMRPIVQTNSMEVSGDFVEIASATGTAVQTFRLGLDISGNGYPKLKLKLNSDSNKELDLDFKRKTESGESETTTTKIPQEEQQSQTMSSGSVSGSDPDSDSSETTTNFPPSTKQNFLFDKPFLWYLNDAVLGPMFYGIVTKIESTGLEEDEVSEVDEDPDAYRDAFRYLMWSCRSFKQSAEIEDQVSGESVTGLPLPAM